MIDLGLLAQALVPSKPFIYGVLGSMSGELLVALKLVSSSQEQSWPPKYSRKAFYVLHCAIALIAGAIVEAYALQNLMAAFHIGVTTPILIEQLARQPPAMPPS